MHSRVWRAAAAAAGAAAAATAHVSTSAVWCSAPVHESCSVVGDGLRAEFWQHRHRNLTVLERDDVTVQLLMTVLRDRETDGSEFTLVANRLFSHLVEHATAELPTEEVQVETPSGHKYAGVRLKGSFSNLLGISIANDSRCMLPVLKARMPMLKTGFVRTTERADAASKEVTEYMFPDEIELDDDLHVLILDPAIARGRSVTEAVRLLLTHGVKEENIVLLTLTLSPSIADKLCAKYPAMRIVSASIEAGMDESLRLVPGVGYFYKRFDGETVAPEASGSIPSADDASH